MQQMEVQWSLLDKQGANLLEEERRLPCHLKSQLVQGRGSWDTADQPITWGFTPAFACPPGVCSPSCFSPLLPTNSRCHCFILKFSGLELGVDHVLLHVFEGSTLLCLSEPRKHHSVPGKYSLRSIGQSNVSRISLTHQRRWEGGCSGHWQKEEWEAAFLQFGVPTYLFIYSL